MDFTNLLSLWFIIKILALILLGMYIIFALVVVRQVKLMTHTLQLGFEQFTKTLVFAHLLFAILVFVAAMVIL